MVDWWLVSSPLNIISYKKAGHTTPAIINMKKPLR